MQVDGWFFAPSMAVVAKLFLGDLAAGDFSPPGGQPVPAVLIGAIIASTVAVRERTPAPHFFPHPYARAEIPARVGAAVNWAPQALAPPPGRRCDTKRTVKWSLQEACSWAGAELL